VETNEKNKDFCTPMYQNEIEKGGGVTITGVLDFEVSCF
jgi:hypothetical protein